MVGSIGGPAERPRQLTAPRMRPLTAREPGRIVAARPPRSALRHTGAAGRDPLTTALVFWATFGIGKESTMRRRLGWFVVPAAIWLLASSVPEASTG